MLYFESVQLIIFEGEKIQQQKIRQEKSIAAVHEILVCWLGGTMKVAGCVCVLHLVSYGILRGGEIHKCITS